MALNNPINFFKTDEKNALLNKNKAVNKITTTSVTFVDKPNNTTKESIAANDATGDGAIFIEGKKVIQGVSVAEKQYLWDQIAAKELARYSATYVSVSNDTFTDFSCPKTELIFKFDALYDGVGTTKVTKATVNNVTATKAPETGRYIGNVELPASTTGYQKVTATFSFTNDNTGYKSVTCNASKTISHAAKSVIISTTKNQAPKDSDITSAAVKSEGIAGTRSFRTTANMDMWICTPSYVSYSTIKSGGFDVPFDAAIQVTVNGITYNCRRKTDTPSASTGTITMVIA